MAAVLSGITRVLSMSDGDDASWAALREDLREQYATGDLIEWPSELIAEIDRINNLRQMIGYHLFIQRFYYQFRLLAHA